MIRALEPLEGIEDMRTRRGPVKRERDLTNGPGKLTIAMGITRAHNGVDLTEGELIVCRDRNRQHSRSRLRRVSGSHTTRTGHCVFISRTIRT
ncbi:MAG: DNA-3-methyladenine glycosylase [Acidobacteriota bacterium]